MTRFLTAAFCLLASPAVADLKLAMDLGHVLASEEACELDYSEAAISAFIQERVDPEEVGFAWVLADRTRAAKKVVERLTGSEYVANCAAVTNTARHFGFIE